MPDSKFRILVLGIGGVGGYLGGLLAKYSSDANTEVIFFCRGGNLNAIKNNGLILKKDDGEIQARPFLVTNDATKTGRIDLLLCCVKGFDLEESLKPLINYITNKTIVIPFLNGIDAYERIKHFIPDSRIWKGCIYLVSRLISPGVVRQTGPINQIFFGSDKESDSTHQYIENIFRSASLNASYSDSIQIKLWEKFYFISAMATITSFFNSSIGEIQKDPAKSQLIMNLLLELQLVTTASEISLSPGLVENTFLKIMTLAPETTSSMLNDFQNGNKTELEEITGYVVHKGNALNVTVPTYEMMYRNLLNRMNSIKMVR